ncbi:hypothetical protein DPEC_G00306240 [Dallia pectoralis]|uniref:Uncharacterized protein n=1 Tax=Dallia pectoralis TaxID=75939 RepID=A0ACC2FDX3_DALPE|nr:hypothetical protein DPEC_G00306240 [Dallia pectoralis]
MSEPMYREWILETIDSLRSRKARPDLDRICRMVRRRHGSEAERTCAELDKLIREQTVLKVNYKGSVSYRNAAKVHRRSRKRDDRATRRSPTEDADPWDVSNGDSGGALGLVDREETADPEDEVPVSMETDSTIEEEEEVEGADEDGHEGSSPGGVDAVKGGSGDTHPQSAPCSPSSTVSDRPPTIKTSRRSSSLPPSSPPALRQKECVSDTAFCPAEDGLSEMERNTGPEGNLKTVAQPSGTCPWVQERTIEDEMKTEDSGFTSDQLVPDCADESREGSERKSQALSFPFECAQYTEMNVASYVMAQDNVKNGQKNGQVSAKMDTTRQNLLFWSVADVASYFTIAGFPEQALAFRTQEIDGKSLLLMQRSDVLTGLSIRLGPALKIYERHVKVLQRTHFLDEEDGL